MAFAVLFVVGCKTDDGRDGIDGEKGGKGDKGDPGLNGNANVIVSEWKTSALAKDTTIDLSTMKVATVVAPELTAARLTNSVVYVYMDYGGGAYPLPFISNPLGRTSTISYFTKVGKVRPTRLAHDGGATINIPSNIKFRYLIIPSGTLKNDNGIDYNDYESVKKYYNIKD